MKHYLARLAAGILIALAAVAVGVVPAHAASTAVVAGVQVAFSLDPLAVVQLLVAFVLPVLVGIVTTRVTKPGRKAWLLAGLSLLTSLLVELARAIGAGETYDVGVAFLAALPAFVISVSSHYGLWKPTGVAEAVKSIGRTAGEEI